VEELAQLFFQRLVAEAIQLGLLVDVLGDLDERPLHLLGSEAVHPHQLARLTRSAGKAVEGLPIDAPRRAQPLAALEPVGRDLGVLPPAPVDDPRREEGAIEEDLRAQHRRTGDATVEREMGRAGVDRFEGDVVPFFRVGRGVRAEAGCVDLHYAPPPGVVATALDLIGGERLVTSAVQFGGRPVRRLGVGRGRGLTVAAAGAEGEGEGEHKQLYLSHGKPFSRVSGTYG
jgi:hypothetical protein